MFWGCWAERLGFKHQGHYDMGVSICDHLCLAIELFWPLLPAPNAENLNLNMDVPFTPRRFRNNVAGNSGEACSIFAPLLTTAMASWCNVLFPTSLKHLQHLPWHASTTQTSEA